jgi:hypothetical protein
VVSIKEEDSGCKNVGESGVVGEGQVRGRKGWYRQSIVRSGEKGETHAGETDGCYLG